MALIKDFIPTSGQRGVKLATVHLQMTRAPRTGSYPRMGIVLYILMTHF